MGQLRCEDQPPLRNRPAKRPQSIVAIQPYPPATPKAANGRSAGFQIAYVCVYAMLAMFLTSLQVMKLPYIDEEMFCFLKNAIQPNYNSISYVS